MKRLCAGGATLIQLREKQMSPRGFYEAAKRALLVARSYGARVIINDRADLALALAADGVHLGQDDLPPSAARALLGKDAIIGFSTHTLEQAKAASTLPVDYVAFGPIFETQSKANPDAVVGLEGLRLVREAIGEMPLVAIGGIALPDVEKALAAGADSVAVISLLLANPNEIEARTRAILASR